MIKRFVRRSQPRSIGNLPSRQLTPILTASVLHGISEVFFAVSVGSVIFLGLGFFKLGGLVRFIPYPVVGGFLAGTGWLLVQGSFGTMTNLPLMASNITELVLPNQLALWLPGVVFAFILFIGLLRSRHFLTMPVILMVHWESP